MAWTTPADWSNAEIVTNTKLNTHLRDQLRELWHEIAYVEFAAAVTVTTGTHTEASPVDVVSAGAITYAALPIWVEFFSPSCSTGNSGLSLSLWDGATDLGRIVNTGSALDLIATAVPGYRRLTPTAASHTYKVRAWTGSANGSVGGGAGGTGVLMPGFIRISQKGGT